LEEAVDLSSDRLLMNECMVISSRRFGGHIVTSHKTQSLSTPLLERRVLQVGGLYSKK
jgi:hypothetical protein